MLDQDFIYTLLLTGKLALITTVILILIGIPVAYWLSYSRFKLKFIAETLISMPMVLPPTVMGYYLLVAFSPENAFGDFLQKYCDVRLAFSFQGIVIASIIANLPFMIQPLQNGFSALNDDLRQASYTMGKSKIVTLFKVLIPNIKKICYHWNCAHFCPLYRRIWHRDYGWRKYSQRNQDRFGCDI